MSQKLLTLRPMGGWVLSVLIGSVVSSCDSSQRIHPSVEGPLSLGEGLRLGILVSEDYWLGARSPSQVINAAYLLRDRVNACGGINQAPVSILIEEADGTSRAEINAMETLIDEYRVHGIIAQLSSQNPAAALEIAEQSKTPLLIASLDEMNSSFNAEPMIQDWGYTTPSPKQSMQAFSQLIVKRGYSQVFLVTSESNAIRARGDLFIDAYAAQNGQVVNAEQPLRWKIARDNNSSEADLNASNDDDTGSINQLQEVLRQNSSEEGQWAIATILDRPDGEDFLNTMMDLDWPQEDIPIFWYGQESLVRILERMQPAELLPSQTLDELAGITGISPTAVGGGFQNFLAAWQSRLNDSLKGTEPYAWDAAALLVLAAQSAKQNSRAGILSELTAIANPPGTAVSDVCKALEYMRNETSINFEGASGSVNINRFGEIPGVFNVWRLNPDGKIVTLERLTLDSDKPTVRDEN